MPHEKLAKRQFGKQKINIQWGKNLLIPHIWHRNFE